MTVNIFPCNTPQRVPLPLPSTLLACDCILPSWRVIFGRETVPVFIVGQSEGGADDEGYFPINAVYLEACPCKISACPDVKVFINDGLSRCSVWLNQAFIVPPAGKTAQPQTLEWKIRAAAAGIGTDLLHGSISLTPPTGDPNGPPTQKGMIAMVAGVLGTQFEFWARIFNSEVFSAQPVDVRIQMVVDRVDGEMAAVLGTISGGVDLPVVNPAQGP